MIHPSYVELMKVVNEDTALVGEEPVVNSRYSNGEKSKTDCFR